MKKKLFVIILCVFVFALPILVQAWVSQEFTYKINFNDSYKSPVNNYIYDDMGYNYTANCPIPVAYFQGSLLERDGLQIHTLELQEIAQCHLQQ